MNLEPIITWGIKILEHLDNKEYPQTVDEKELERKLNWLPFFRYDLLRWKRVIDHAMTAEKFIRSSGYKIGVTCCF